MQFWSKHCLWYRIFLPWCYSLCWYFQELQLSLNFQRILDFLMRLRILLFLIYFLASFLHLLAIELNAKILLHFKLFVHLLQLLYLLRLDLQFLNQFLAYDLISIIKLLGLPLSLLQHAFLFLLLFWNDSLQPLILKHLFLILLLILLIKHLFLFFLLLFILKEIKFERHHLILVMLKVIVPFPPLLLIILQTVLRFHSYQ
jgi:hypothetical protein